jgi:hypothetical protein
VAPPPDAARLVLPVGELDPRSFAVRTNLDQPDALQLLEAPFRLIRPDAQHRPSLRLDDARVAREKEVGVYRDLNI